MNDMIQSLGFPIAMCLYLIYMQNTTIRRNTQCVEELIQTIKEVFERESR